MTLYSKRHPSGEVLPDADLHRSRWDFFLCHGALKVYSIETKTVSHGSTCLAAAVMFRAFKY